MPITTRRCHVDHSEDDYRHAAQRTQARFLQQERIPSTEVPIALFVRYVCFYVDESEKVSIERINANHQVLRDAFTGKDPGHVLLQELEANNPEQYPFYSAIGNPNIHFYPKAITQVEYVKTDRYFGEVPIEDVIEVGSPMSNVVNVFIGSNGSGSTILGQAAFPYSSLYVFHGSVGGPSAHGTATGYHLGKTLVHEMAHTLGLLHVFSVLKGECDNIKHHNDVPEQFTPNYEADFVRVNGKLMHLNDHRYQEAVLKTGASHSCVGSSAFSGTMEQACNYLDYGRDEVLCMFSKDQCEDMRDNVPNVMHLKAYTIEEAETITTVSAVGGAGTTSGGTTTEVEGNSTVPEESEFIAGTDFGSPSGSIRDDSSTTTTLPLLSLFLIVMGIVILGIAAYSLWFARQSRKRYEKVKVAT